MHWDYLLKKAPSNPLVVGTGISELINDSPQFLRKFPSVNGQGSPAMGFEEQGYE